MNTQDLALSILTECFLLSSSSLMPSDDKEGRGQAWGPTAAEQRETVETRTENRSAQAAGSPAVALREGLKCSYLSLAEYLVIPSERWRLRGCEELPGGHLILASLSPLRGCHETVLQALMSHGLPPAPWGVGADCRTAQLQSSTGSQGTHSPPSCAPLTPLRSFWCRPRWCVGQGPRELASLAPLPFVIYTGNK